MLRGAGRSFCAGFDFGGGFHHWDEALTTDGAWDPGKDFVMATAPSARARCPKFMSLWRSPKPVIAQVHGWCVGGGSDMALCADLVIASRGRADRHALLAHVGLLPHGHVALPAGADQGEGARADRQAAVGHRGGRGRGWSTRRCRSSGWRTRCASAREQLAAIPLSQLAAMKLIVNQAYENMGLASTQMLGPILDGLMRNTPDALRFIEPRRDARA